MKPRAQRARGFVNSSLYIFYFLFYCLFIVLFFMFYFFPFSFYFYAGTCIVPTFIYNVGT